MRRATKDLQGRFIYMKVASSGSSTRAMSNDGLAVLFNDISVESDDFFTCAKSYDAIEVRWTISENQVEAFSHMPRTLRP